MPWLQQVTEDGLVEVDDVRAVLLAHTEKVARMGSWVWNLATDQMFWSENLLALFDLAPDESVPERQQLIDRVLPEDRELFARTLANVRAGLGSAEARVRILSADGTVRRLHATVAVETASGGQPILVGATRDVTAATEAEQAITALVAVAEALSAANGFEIGVREAICGVCAALDLSAGTLWHEAGGRLAPRIHYGRGDSAPPISASSRNGRALVLRAQEAGRPVFASELPDYAGGLFPVSQLPLVAVPAWAGGVAAAVLVLHGRVAPAPTGRLRATLTGVGHELGDFLAHHQAQLLPMALTAREREMLTLASNGNSNPTIAAQLHLSASTVKTHFENIFRKYEVPDRTAAVAKALREGMIE